MSSKTRLVRMVDVARLAGVSPMTVSGAFREPGDTYSVAPATREKVLEAARKLGYKPNAMARAMRRREFRNIGFLVVKPPEYLWLVPASLAGVYDGLNNNGYHLTFIGLPPSFDPAKDTLPKSFQEELIDALIVDCTLGVSPKTEEILSKAQFPICKLNQKSETNSVWVDDDLAMRQAVRHVIALGYQRPAFFSFNNRGRDTHYSFAMRRNTYFSEMGVAGIKAREISVAEVPQGHAEFLAELNRLPRPDVLICYSDVDAILAQRAFIRLGIRVPDDIGLITFRGNFPNLSPVDVAAMDIPWYRMGRKAADMVLTMAKEHERSLPSARFEAPLVPGESLRKIGG